MKKKLLKALFVYWFTCFLLTVNIYGYQYCNYRQPWSIMSGIYAILWSVPYSVLNAIELPGFLYASLTRQKEAPQESDSGGSI